MRNFIPSYHFTTKVFPLPAILVYGLLLPYIPVLPWDFIFYMGRMPHQVISRALYDKILQFIGDELYEGLETQIPSDQ